jgi:thioredoxin reductase
MTELVIVGGGPAGLSAAVMAESLGVSTTIVERERSVGGRVGWISSIANLAGFSGSASDLLRTMQTQAEAIDCQQHDVLKVSSDDSGLFRLAHSSGSIVAPTVIWAAGLRPRLLSDLLSNADEGDQGSNDLLLVGPNFERIGAEQNIVVVGADRPVGTLLRSFPTLAPRITLLCFPGEDYKALEVRKKYGVEAVACDHVVAVSDEAVTVELLDRTKTSFDRRELAVVTNLGSIPNTEPLADLSARDEVGYIEGPLPPGLTLVGDVSSPSHQRIATAIGSGARAALDHFYARASAHGRAGDR